MINKATPVHEEDITPKANRENTTSLIITIYLGNAISAIFHKGSNWDG
jgi:hypothetical protein